MKLPDLSNLPVLMESQEKMRAVPQLGQSAPQDDVNDLEHLAVNQHPQASQPAQIAHQQTTDQALDLSALLKQAEKKAPLHGGASFADFIPGLVADEGLSSLVDNPLHQPAWPKHPSPLQVPIARASTADAEHSTPPVAPPNARVAPSPLGPSDDRAIQADVPQPAPQAFGLGLPDFEQAPELLDLQKKMGVGTRLDLLAGFDEQRDAADGAVATGTAPVIAAPVAAAQLPLATPHPVQQPMPTPVEVDSASVNAPHRPDHPALLEPPPVDTNALHMSVPDLGRFPELEALRKKMGINAWGRRLFVVQPPEPPATGEPAPAPAEGPANDLARFPNLISFHTRQIIEPAQTAPMAQPAHSVVAASDQADAPSGDAMASIKPSPAVHDVDTAVAMAPVAASDDAPPRADEPWNPFAASSTVAVEPAQLTVLRDATLVLGSRRVIFYNRETTTGSIRFHVAHCTTVQKIVREQKPGQHVASCEPSLVCQVPTREGDSSEKRLTVCRHCLELLAWQGYDARDWTEIQKKQEVDRFSLQEFFEVYPPFVGHPADLAPLGVDPLDWRPFLASIREKSGWICAACQLNLSAQEHHQFLSVQHRHSPHPKAGVQGLTILCIGCLAAQPLYHRLKTQPLYRAFAQTFQR